MPVTCARCARVLEYSGEPPKFCGYCGQLLAPTAAALTTPPTYDPEAATLAPAPAAAANGDVPETVGGYRLRRRLGGGGMGSVYEAEDPASGRRVALKLVLPEYAESPDAVERFRQEGQLASTLAHPRCVFVLAVDEDAGRPYIVMELMPGQTLDDLVAERGPLPPDEAITRILDVIDGLHEAHQRGLVHRDVKPSNCFLEADGRVKVGDFGLAKSLVTGSKLTRTGTFLGTPLFASPEQIKLEPVDAQSDVYSVAATLYYLLTGQAPFQTGDTMATLARIVSDDPPPMRSLRPELPKALDRVVLRGLERDRKRRWKNLDEFRRALVSFLPAKPSIGGTGLRFGAYAIDYVLLVFARELVGLGLLMVTHHRPTLFALDRGIGALIYLVYFGVLEGFWGWSLAKYLLRLRVGTAPDPRPPGLGRALVRASILFVLFNAGTITAQIVLLAYLPADPTAVTGEHGRLVATVGCANLTWMLFAVGLMVSTMRTRNGYRGLHEVLSGTHTYRLHWPQPRKRQAVQSRPFALAMTQPEGLPERVGVFRIRGAVRWTERERTLVGEDAQLKRSVWIWMRPATEAALDPARRDISRDTRIRWVACGTQGDWQWDAFLAPAGMPLPALAAHGQRLSWTAIRPLLEDLAEELAASCADGTLPHSLTAHQVWVQPNGRVQLLGTPLSGTDSHVSSSGASGKLDPLAGNDAERALQFLRHLVSTALEGSPRPPGAIAESIRAPVPVHATPLFDRLMGVEQPYETVEQLQKDLEAIHHRPTEVSRLRRAGHLALTALLLNIPFFGPFLFLGGPLIILWVQYRWGGGAEEALPVSVTTVFCATFWVMWALLFRGGYAFWRGGIALRRADGRKASRLQCAYRALLVWGPVAGLLCLAVAVAQAYPRLPVVYFGLYASGVILLAANAVLAIWYPQRSLHDWLAGTYLVPN